jgi:hypothetical protein
VPYVRICLCVCENLWDEGVFVSSALAGVCVHACVYARLRIFPLVAVCRHRYVRVCVSLYAHVNAKKFKTYLGTHAR